MDGDAGLLANRDRLLDAFLELLPVVAQVRRVKAAGGAGGTRQRDELVGLGVCVGRVDQSGGHAVGALLHGVSDEPRHLLQLGRLRRAFVVAHHVLAHLAEPDVRQQVDRRFRPLDGGEVAGKVTPAALGGRFLRGDRPAFADHFRRDALADLALRVAVDEQREVRMRMRIDEAGRHHLPARVDRPRRGAADPADTRDASVANADRAGDGRSAGAINDASVGDEEVEGPAGLLRGREQREARRRDRGEKQVSSRADYIAAGTKRAEEREQRGRSERHNHRATARNGGSTESGGATGVAQRRTRGSGRDVTTHPDSSLEVSHRFSTEVVDPFPILSACVSAGRGRRRRTAESLRSISVALLLRVMPFAPWPPLAQRRRAASRA